MNNFTLCPGAILEGLGGPNAAFFSRGAGTVLALARRRSRSLKAPARALVGGADSALHPVTWSELARAGHAGEGLVPGEGAAVLSLGAGGRPLALLEQRALNPPPGAVAGEASRRGDRALGRAGTAAADRAGARRLPRAQLLDLGACLGETLAAEPALAWVVALDLVARGAARASSCSARDSTVSSASSPSRGPVTAVITGVGVVSAFGVGARAFEAGLARGAPPSDRSAPSTRRRSRRASRARCPSRPPTPSGCRVSGTRSAARRLAGARDAARSQDRLRAAGRRRGLAAGGLRRGRAGRLAGPRGRARAGVPRGLRAAGRRPRRHRLAARRGCRLAGDAVPLAGRSGGAMRGGPPRPARSGRGPRVGLRGRCAGGRARGLADRARRRPRRGVRRHRLDDQSARRSAACPRSARRRRATSPTPAGPSIAGATAS